MCELKKTFQMYPGYVTPVQPEMLCATQLKKRKHPASRKDRKKKIINEITISLYLITTSSFPEGQPRLSELQNSM